MNIESKTSVVLAITAGAGVAFFLTRAIIHHFTDRKIGALPWVP